MPTGEQIKGGVENIIGKTIAAAHEGYADLVLRFTDGSYWSVEVEDNCSCGECEASLQNGQPSLRNLETVGVLSAEEFAAAASADQARKAALKTERDRLDYERLKAKFERP